MINIDETAKPSQNLYRSWLTIWYSPGKTIRQIATTDPEFAVYFISALYVFFFTGQAAWLVHFSISGKDQVPNPFLNTLVSFLLNLAVAIVISKLLLYAFSAGLYWIGKTLGGKASYLAVLGALGWSLTPGLLVGLFFIILWIFHPVRLPLEIGVGIYILMLIWQTVVLVTGMMAIENYSIPRAIASVFMGIALGLLILSGCVAIFYFGVTLLATRSS